MVNGKFQRVLGMFLRRTLLPHRRFFQSCGLHLTPVHYYYPIPNTEDLPDDLFTRIQTLAGIEMNGQGQRRYLQEVVIRYLAEFEPTTGKMMSQVDAFIYYCMIRHHKPAKVVEIGSGESTMVAASACLRNTEEGHPVELVAVEPFPSRQLKRGLPGLSRLIEKRIQDVDLSEILDCDLLFIDSTHVAMIGSDVLFEFSQVIPNLKAGALIHWHDIFLPKEYPRSFVFDMHMYWNEQYLLQCFLAFNNRYRVIWASNYMFETEGERCRDGFGALATGDYPVSSFWVRKD